MIINELYNFSLTAMPRRGDPVWKKEKASPKNLHHLDNEGLPYNSLNTLTETINSDPTQIVLNSHISLK